MFRSCMTHFRPALGLAVGLAVLGASPAPALASGDVMKTARFHMTVSGTQTTDWTMDHTRYDGCIDGETRTSGAGNERITFKSIRRAPLDVVGIGDDVVASAGARGLRVRGTVSQQGELRHEQLSGGESYCGGTDEPQEAPAPDCGKRAWRGTLTPIVYAPADYPAVDLIAPLVPVLALNGPDLADGRALGDLFRNCPGADGQLAPTPDSGFVSERVFSKAKRLVIRGKDTMTTPSVDGYVTTVTTRWRAVLVRRGRTMIIRDRSER